VSSLSEFGDCVFATRRLSIGPWHGAAQEHGINLTEAVTGILTHTTTQSLPPSWQGEYTVERAGRWVVERDGESPTLLAVDRGSGEPVGLMMLHEDFNEDGVQSNLRIGYVVKESFWGEGIASELVSGLVDWARSQTRIRSIIAGVESQNAASVRVLVKNGFRLTDRGPAENTDTYTLELRSRHPTWKPAVTPINST